MEAVTTVIVIPEPWLTILQAVFISAVACSLWGFLQLAKKGILAWWLVAVLGICLCIGTALGAAVFNIGKWLGIVVAIGLTFGTVIAAALPRRRKYRLAPQNLVHRLPLG